MSGNKKTQKKWEIVSGIRWNIPRYRGVFGRDDTVVDNTMTEHPLIGRLLKIWMHMDK